MRLLRLQDHTFRPFDTTNFVKKTCITPLLTPAPSLTSITSNSLCCITRRRNHEVSGRRGSTLNNNKRSLITVNLINCTIYLPKGHELKKMKTYTVYTLYKIEIKDKICEYHNIMQYQYTYIVRKSVILAFQNLRNSKGLYF